MNIPKFLIKARKAMGLASLHAAANEKAARIARQTARTAKAKLKQSRKLAKLTRKAARKAKNQATESWEVFERARAYLKKAEEKAARHEKKQKPVKPTKSIKPKPVAKIRKTAKRLAGSRPKPRIFPSPSPLTATEEIIPATNQNAKNENGGSSQSNPPAALD